MHLIKGFHAQYVTIPRRAFINNEYRFSLIYDAYIVISTKVPIFGLPL